jgi:hypothetical protein
MASLGGSHGLGLFHPTLLGGKKAIEVEVASQSNKVPGT